MYKVKVNNKYDFEVDKQQKDLLVDSNIIVADIQQLKASLYHVINNHTSYTAEVVNFDRETKTAGIKVNNNTYTVSAKDQFDVLLDTMGLSNLNTAKVSDIKAPMPGLVLKIFAEVGNEIKKGENLFVLEAMKMENIIKAPADAIVRAIKINPGDKVEKGQVLMLF